MDHSGEILTELRALRVDLARVETKIGNLEKADDERKVEAVALELRVRNLEQGRVGSLVGAASGGGGLAVLIQWLLNHVGG